MCLLVWRTWLPRSWLLVSASKRSRTLGPEEALPRLVPPWVIHDLRRTFRTRLSELRVPDLVAELAIAHRKPGLHKVYDQHAYRAEKREAMLRWETRLRAILAPPAENVLPFEEPRHAS